MSYYSNLTFSPATPALKEGDKVKYKETYGSGYLKFNGLDTAEIKHMVNVDSALIVYPANAGRGYYKPYGAIVNISRLVKADELTTGWYKLKNIKNTVYYVKAESNGKRFYTHSYDIPTKQLSELIGGPISVGNILDGDLVAMEFVTSL